MTCRLLIRKLAFVLVISMIGLIGKTGLGQYYVVEHYQVGPTVEPIYELQSYGSVGVTSSGFGVESIPVSSGPIQYEVVYPMPSYSSGRYQFQQPVMIDSSATYGTAVFAPQPASIQSSAAYHAGNNAAIGGAQFRNLQGQDRSGTVASKSQPKRMKMAYPSRLHPEIVVPGTVVPVEQVPPPMVIRSYQPAFRMYGTVRCIGGT